MIMVWRAVPGGGDEVPLGQTGRNGHMRNPVRLRESRFPGGAGVDRPGAVFDPQVPGQIAGRHHAPERYLVLGVPRPQRYLRPPDRPDQDESFFWAAEAFRP